MKMLENLSEIFFYAEDSPTGLRWKISPSFSVKIGDIAGTPVNFNGVLRYRVMYQRKVYLVSRVIFKMFNPDMDDSLYVDHFDGNPLNNCIGNLRLVSAATNSQNKSMNRSNTSGKAGVYFHVKTNSWRANWRENLIVKQKSFSCNKYSNAFELATTYRKNMLEQLNKAGECYTERHGTSSN